MATPKKRVSAKAAAPPEKERRKRRTMSQNDMLTFWTSEGFLIPQRVIYLGSVTTDVEGNESYVDSAMAKKFEVAMRALEYFDAKSPITVVMNNPGGNWYHGMAIYDRIMDSPCPVTIHATGHVMSMGAVIIQAADKRLLTRNATVLLHYGQNGFDGHAIDHERSAEEGKRLRLEMEELFLAQMVKKDPTMTLEKLRELLRFDTFMDAAKAIRLGLADGFVPRTKHKRAKPAQTTPGQQHTPQD